MRHPWSPWHLLTTVSTLLALAGCATIPRDPLPKLTVDTARLEQGPPVPREGAAAQAVTDFVIDQDLIAPEKMENYQALPTTVTQIYDTPPRPVTLRDVVVQSLTNDRAIKIQGYTYRTATYEVPASQGIYDLNATGQLFYQRIEQQAGLPTAGLVPVSQSRAISGQAQLSQLLPFGSTINLAYDALRLWDNGAPATTEDGTINLTQPLLRGFGWFVTNAPIYLARLAAQGSAADFETTVDDQLVQALNAYWDLVGAIELYKVDEIAYAATLDLVRINREKYRVQVIPMTDLLDAEAGLDSRRLDLIQARRNIRDLEDQLKRLVFLDGAEPNWKAQLQPTQPVGWRDLRIDWDQAIAQALARRPELRRAETNWRQARVNWRVARNNRLPFLNLFGQLSTNGLGDNFSAGFSEMADAKATSYQAGLEFSFPLQNRTARYRFRQAQARLDQAEEQLHDTRDQVVEEVRQAARSIATTAQSIEVTRSQVLSEQANLTSQMQRYSVGLAITFEVLQFQTNLANAQARHVQAIIDHNKAVVAFERATGTLLDTYGIDTTDAGLKEVNAPAALPAPQP